MQKRNDNSCECRDTVWTFYIRTFPYFKEHEVLTIRVSPNHNLIYKDVKEAALRMLGLKRQSKKLFGIFKLLPSMFIVPMKLCHDDSKDFVFDNYEELGILRLSCSKREEVEVIKNDTAALDLIYWEATNFLDVGNVSDDKLRSVNLIMTSSKVKGNPGLDLVEHKVLFPSDETNPYQLLQRRRSNRDYLKLALNSQSRNKYFRIISLKDKRTFLNSIYRTCSYYWNYFYIGLGCRLCGDNLFLLSCSLGLDQDLHCDIIMNSATLSVLSYNQSRKHYSQLLSIPWRNICSLYKDDSLQMFCCQVCCEDKDSYVSYMSASFCTMQYDYLYTMSMYFVEKIHFQDKKEKRGNIVTDCLKPALEVNSKVYSASFRDSRRLNIPDQTIDASNGDYCYINKSFVPALLSMKNAYINYSLQQEADAVKSRKLLDLAPTGSYCRGKMSFIAPSSNSNKKNYNDTRNDTCIQQKDVEHSNYEAQHEIISDVKIFTFAKETPILVKPKLHSIGALKKKVGQQLNLVPKSLHIFGFFTCSEASFQYPIQLCSESKAIPKDPICFRRLSFDKGLEKAVRKHDYVALQLLFYEALYMVKNKLLFPSVSQEELQKLKKNAYLIENPKSSDDIKHSLMDQFLEDLNSISPFWWYFYYKVKVKGYNLFESIENYNPPLSIASLTIDHITLSDTTGTSAILIPWSRISAILMQESGGASVSEQLKIEVVTDNRKDTTEPGDKLLTAIPIDTTNTKFFFSVAKHIIGLLDQQHKNHNLMERQRLFVDHFTNTTFKGPGCVFYYPDPVSQHINPTFTGTDC